MAQLLLKTLRLLLRPAVLLSVKNGLKVQDLTEAMKAEFVSAAQKELHREGDSQSKSRIAVMTGLQRRDISRLLEVDPPGSKTPNILLKLIGQWSSDKRFCKGNKPQPLTHEGAQSEFFSLVQSVSKDLNPYTLLFELQRIGAVETIEEKLHLKTKAYDARSQPEQGWILWSQDAEDLLASVEENLYGNEKIPNLHISTRYDNVIQEEIPSLRQWILEKGAQFHAEIRAHVSRFDKDLNPALFSKAGGGKIVINSVGRAHLKSEQER